MNTKENTPLIWQSAIHLAISIVLFVPAIFIGGFIVSVLDFFQEGYIGRTGDGIGFIMRGFQYFGAGYFSLIIPAMFLHRTNMIIVCTIFGTIVFLFFAATILLSAFHPHSNAQYDLYEWASILASFVGATASAFIAKDAK